MMLSWLSQEFRSQNLGISLKGFKNMAPEDIAKSIEELATIFKELAVLVIDQGTILDRIDFNMEQV